VPSRSTLIGRSIRCLLFDLGDTLWIRKDPATWYNLEQEANRQAVLLLRMCVAPDNLPVLDDITLGDEVRKAVERLLRDQRRQSPEYEPDFAQLSLQGLRQLGIVGVDKQLGVDIFEALRVRIPASRIVFPDVLSTLRALRERGFLLGVVTNRYWGGQPFQDDLRAIGFLDYLAPEHIAVSADLGVRKPNPAIFLHALNALGVSAEEAAMVGDSLSADVAGARRLNIFAIWKPKPPLFAEARAARRAAQMAQEQGMVQQQVYALEKAHLEILADPVSEVPLSLESADDDYLINYAKSRQSKRKQHLYHQMKPDLIVEHLSELLDVFTEAGCQ
jgi:FMN phosphatase YigB (HAD superfamily)